MNIVIGGNSHRESASKTTKTVHITKEQLMSLNTFAFKHFCEVIQLSQK